MDWEETQFEHIDHQAMLNMMADARGPQVVAVGDSLVRAGDRIQEAANKLMSKAGRVSWEGQSATSFQTWASDLITSSFQLADYTKGTGRQIQVVGQKIIETRLPEISAADTATLAALEKDPAAGAQVIDVSTGQTALAAATLKVHSARMVAATAMEALASTYRTSVEQINLLAKPQFKPPPDVHKIGERRGDENEDAGAMAGIVGAAGVAAASQTSLAGGSNTGTATPYTAPAGSSAGAWPPPQSTGAPSVVTAGQVTPGALPPGSNLLNEPRPTQHASTSTAGQVGGSGPNGSGPTGVRPSVPGMPGVPPAGGAVRAGSPGVLGGTSSGQVRPGTTAGGRPSGAPGLRTGGIEGGTARPGQTPGEPRAGTSPRTGMPMGGIGGVGPGASGTTSRRSAARPPIGAPGGVVGGNTGRGAPASRGQFSSGGSGLRSGIGQSAPPQGTGRPIGGMMGAGAAAGPDDRARRRRRAEYLEEDDETWGGAQSGGAVPPVIG